MLRVTTAGRAALADPNNVGVQAVRITRVLVGSGSGPGGAADDSRTTLRTQRDAAAAGGAVQVAARIAVRADVVGTAAYAVTEAGLEAAVGAGAAFLFAYWTNGGEVYAAVADGVAVLVVAAIDIVSGTPADLTVAIDPTVALSGATAFGALSDVPAGLVANSYYRGSGNGRTLAPVTAAEVLDDILAGLPGGSYPRVREVAGVRSLEGRTLAQLLGDLAGLVPVVMPAGSPPSTSWSSAGTIVVPAGWRFRGLYALRASPNGRIDFRIRRSAGTVIQFASLYNPGNLGQPLSRYLLSQVDATVDFSDTLTFEFRWQVNDVSVALSRSLFFALPPG